MADSPIPIIATVREAVEQTGHIERLAGHIEGEAAQRQRWFRDPKWLTLVLAIVVALGGPSVGVLYNTITYYNAAKNRNDIVDQKMTVMQAELSILAAMKPQLDTVIRDEMRLEVTVGAVEKDASNSREQFGQKLAALDASVTLMISAMQHLSDELHQLNQRHSEIRIPPREFSSEAPASFAPTSP